MGNVDTADLLFKQARDQAPTSAYIYALSASFERARNKIGIALTLVNEACKLANKKTGALCYTIKANIHDQQRNRMETISSLSKALEYDPSDDYIRHQYGVALSRNGQRLEAIKQFSLIIDRERQKEFPGIQLLVALKTRIINLERESLLSEMKADVKLAKELFEKFPHFASERRQFAGFIDNDTE